MTFDPQSMYETADELYLRAIRIVETARGPDDQYLATILGSRARCLQAQVYLPFRVLLYVRARGGDALSEHRLVSRLTILAVREELGLVRVVALIQS